MLLERALSLPAEADPPPAANGPRRHIALVIYGLTGGGAQRRTLTLANGFAERGHRVDLVVVRGRCPLNDQLSPAVRLHAIDAGWPSWHPGSLFTRRPPQVLASIPGLARYLRRARPDIILSAASHINMATVLAWRLAGRPMPLVLRASNHPYGNLHLRPLTQRLVKPLYNRLGGRLYAAADAVIAVSDGVAEAVAELSGLARERISTVYNPMVGAGGTPGQAGAPPHPWLAPGQPRVILAAGRLALQKDFPTLLRAFAEVRKRRPARLAILGEGPQRALLEAQARELGIADDVLMPGAVDELPRWMAHGGLFVLSSLWEGLPGVLIEALSVGCPVVAVDCPSGPAEILEQGALGVLVPARAPGALARAILFTLENPPPRRRLIERAAAFSTEQGIARYLAVLERTITRARQAPAPETPRPVPGPISHCRPCARGPAQALDRWLTAPAGPLPEAIRRPLRSAGGEAGEGGEPAVG